MYSTVDWKCYSLSKRLRKTFQLCIPQGLINKMVLRAFIVHGYFLFEENINKVTDTFKWFLKETHSLRTRKKFPFIL